MPSLQNRTRFAICSRETERTVAEVAEHAIDTRSVFGTRAARTVVNLCNGRQAHRRITMTL